MSVAETAQAREMMRGLMALWQEMSARHSWLYDNQDHPRWERREQATRELEREFAAARATLAVWCGCSEMNVCELIGEVMTEKDDDA